LSAAQPGFSASPESDRHFMLRALGLARAAARRGEVPIGALVARGPAVLGAASNRVERSQDASAHAELLALRQAARRIGSWRLEGVTVYSTLEPCPMCAGAILLARVDRVVYAADDPKKGAFRSVYDVLGSPAGNHHPVVSPGCQAESAGRLLQTFFQELRSRSS
jgi:tRNA(adenine34) deaminase